MILRTTLLALALALAAAPAAATHDSGCPHDTAIISVGANNIHVYVSGFTVFVESNDVVGLQAISGQCHDGKQYEADWRVLL